MTTAADWTPEQKAAMAIWDSVHARHLRALGVDEHSENKALRDCDESARRLGDEGGQR